MKNISLWARLMNLGRDSRGFHPCTITVEGPTRAVMMVVVVVVVAVRTMMMDVMPSSRTVTNDPSWDDDGRGGDDGGGGPHQHHDQTSFQTADGLMIVISHRAVEQAA